MSCLSLLAQSITYHSHVIFQLLQSNFTFLQRLQGAPVGEEEFHPHYPPKLKCFCLLSPRDSSNCNWAGCEQQISGIAGKADRKSYRFEGSVRISKRLFILLRSFFLSGTVWETQTLTTRIASFLADRNTAHCQQWKHEPILKKVVRIKDLSSNPKYIQSISSACFETIKSDLKKPQTNKEKKKKMRI